MSNLEAIEPALSRGHDYWGQFDLDSWYSALVSCVFHFLVVMLTALIATVTAVHERLPSGVGVVSVAETAATGSEMSDEAAGGPLQSTTQAPDPEPAATITPQEKIEEVKPVESSPLSPTPPDAKQKVRDEVEKAAQGAAAARAAARAKLNDNLGGGGADSDSGAGKGRAGRAARWILRFNTSSVNEHLGQLGGLGAEVAFPEQGGKYLYFTDLAGTPRRSTRDLGREQRIYWMDDNPQSYMSLARHLGVSSPPMMIAFLPVALEERMVKLEKAYRGVSDEAEIEQTIFECRRYGGGYEVVVTDQKLR